MPEYTEGGVTITFPDGAQVEKLDAEGRRIPHGMSLADFVVSERERTLVIEVKEPTRGASRGMDLTEAQLANLVDSKLVPKARDTYTYLHLMRRDRKPIVFLSLVDSALFDDSPDLLLAASQRLQRGLHQEADEPWEVQYVARSAVLSPASWRRTIPEYRLVLAREAATS